MAVDPQFFKDYITEVAELELAALEADWGLQGYFDQLFLEPELAKQIDGPWQDYQAEVERVRNKPCNLPPLNSLLKLKIACKAMITHLEPIGKWQATSTYRSISGLKGSDTYRPDGLIRELWRIATVLDPKATLPPLPSANLSAHDAIRALYTLLNWCITVDQNKLAIPVGPAETKGAGDKTTDGMAKKMLIGWPEILDCLGRPDPDYDSIARFNRAHRGPIVIRKGAKPLVERGQLVVWWNGLEETFRKLAEQERDKVATVGQSHPHGRSEVVPEISGAVKQRRKQAAAHVTSQKITKGRKTS